MRPLCLPLALRARCGYGRTRQHAVLGRHPALAAAAQEGRQRFFDAGRAQHAGVAHFDEHRTFGVAGEIAGNRIVRSSVAGWRWLGRMNSYFENFWMVERISSMRVRSRLR